MLRREIVAGVKNLSDSLVKSKVSEALFSVVRGERGPATPDGGLPLFQAFRNYTLLASRYGLVEKQIAAILDLDKLESPEFWGGTISGDDRRAGDVHDTLRAIQDAIGILPRIVRLLEQEGGLTAVAKEGTKIKQDGLQTLTVIAIEENGSSSPERLILALEAVSGLYEIAAGVLMVNGGSLSVVACDSGSDKSFDFLGLAKVMEMVKEIILSVWNKVVFLGEEKSGRHLELIAQSLPIIEQISVMETEGKIEPERAELLRRQTIESVNKFSKAGVTIPEIEKYTVFNPRQLMKPEQKLLVAATDKTDESTSSGKPRKKGRTRSKGADQPE